MKLNARQKMNGLDMLTGLPESYTPLVFFDPQYRGVMDKQKYGNEGARQKERAVLPQMTDDVICVFLAHIDRILKPSGHLMFWVDKFILCSQLPMLTAGLGLNVVDMIVWNKGRMGMGYRTRRVSEYLVVMQKSPVRAKGVWRDHGIRDVWDEKLAQQNHAHSKPVSLQTRLISATTHQGDVVVDPCAGGYSVLEACVLASRDFMGCDLVYGDEAE